MKQCLAITKQLRRCKNSPQHGGVFCEIHRWWSLKVFGGIVGVIITVTTIGANISQIFGVSIIKTATPVPTETLSPTLAPTFTPTATFIPSPEPTETPTVIISSGPVIDSIDFPNSIVCDGRKYDVPIRFHDPDGDTHRIESQLLYSLKHTPYYTDATEFFIDAQEEINGTTFHDFTQWFIPGDEVKIRVYIEDRAKQTAFMDYEFKCSN